VISGSIGNGSQVRGGGAWVAGKLVMNHSTIRDNVAIASTGSAIAGGAYVKGEAQIYASTISGNQADYEGGLVVLQNASINNSTISGNSAPVVGGLSVNGLLVLDNSTVAFNSPTSTFAGVYVEGGVVAHSSIVSNNCYTGSQYCDIECKNCAIVGSKNLIMGANVALPLDTIISDPLLAPLADNGGPTQTHALPAASPALEKGSNIHNYSFDQRGRARSAGIAPDIGAFEAGPDSIFSDGFD
jgi:NDP-sugar pyrophosphorylase family protein